MLQWTDVYVTFQQKTGFSSNGQYIDNTSTDHNTWNMPQ